jgi:hypothetical protein
LPSSDLPKTAQYLYVAMIIKSLSRKSNSAQLVKYLFQRQYKVLSEKKSNFTIRHNLRSNNIESWIKEFHENEAFRLHRRKDNVELFHTIISFSGKDRNLITPEKLKDIAQKYISLRGEDSLYLGTAHVDRDHIHLHIIMSGTKYRTGVANRITRENFRDIKLQMDSYQREKYPELKHSLPNHSKTKVTLPLLRITRAPEKELLTYSLNKAFSIARSADHLISLLHKDGFEPYYRSGKLTGFVNTSGLKFRLSRLGYDKNTLEQLTNRAKEAQEQNSTLQEISSIRKKTRERNILER